MTKNNSIINITSLDFPWITEDPFLFCAHHKDDYPKGNGKLGPDASLTGRNIGQDFTIKEGWRMYHGDRIPGFPSHPHRGFETITVVKEGVVDHADSYGGAGRYGNGDVQWLTAGKGIQHSEMFPLLNSDRENPLELFQVWLNLPASKKMVEPHFKMIWSEDIPIERIKDKAGKIVEIKTETGLAPPPDSWAADPENKVKVMTIKLEAGAKWTLKAGSPDLNRNLYFYKGQELTINDEKIKAYHRIKVKPDREILLKAGESDCYILLLQGKPISEPVSQYGPFVMNTQQEIQQAFKDYEETRFGDWPWPDADQTHGNENRNFARFPDGSEELKP